MAELQRDRRNSNRRKFSPERYTPRPSRSTINWLCNKPADCARSMRRTYSSDSTAIHRWSGELSDSGYPSTVGLILAKAVSMTAEERSHTQFAIQTESSRPHNRQRQESAEVKHDRFSMVGAAPEELELVHEAPRDEDVGENP